MNSNPHYFQSKRSQLPKYENLHFNSEDLKEYRKWGSWRQLSDSFAFKSSPIVVLSKFVKFNSSDSVQSFKTKEPQAEKKNRQFQTEVVETKIDQLLVLLLLLLLAPLDYRPTALTRSSRASILRGLFQSQKHLWFFFFSIFISTGPRNTRGCICIYWTSVHW